MHAFPSPRFLRSSFSPARLIPVVVFPLLATLAQGITYTVSSTNDSGVGSLRAAVAAANENPGPDSINFLGLTGGAPLTITLTSGQIVITDDLTITGPGAKLLTISGNNASLIFVSDVAINRKISGLTLVNGRSQGPVYGGAIHAKSGSLTILDCAFSGNSSAMGGAVYNENSTLTLIGSTFSGNSGGMGGGGVYTTITTPEFTPIRSLIANSTFVGNSAMEGGGIQNRGGIATVLNCTITGNQAPTGAGVLTLGLPYAQTELGNSIIAGNTGSADVGRLYSFGTDFTSRGGNLIGYAATTVAAFTPATNDQVGTQALPLNPKLGPLADNGGQTMTRALLPDSLAIRRGLVSALPLDVLDLDGDSNTTEAIPYDQRGAGFSRLMRAVPDIGALESGRFPEITLAAITATAIEGGANGVYTFTRANDTSDSLMVKFSVNNTSTATVGDYTLTSLSAVTFDSATKTGTITFPVGAETVTITLKATHEALGIAEAAETVKLDLTADPTYDSGASTSATVTIAANGFIVANVNDSGEGSLRQAVLNANAIAGADEITFGSPLADGTPRTITLTSGAIVITSDLSVTGPGAKLLTISGNNASPIFVSDVAVDRKISGLTLANGKADVTVYRGAIHAKNGSLTILDCAFSGNSGGMGGAVNNENSTLTLIGSTFIGNSGVLGGGVCTSVTTMHVNSIPNLIANCTFSGNSALLEGGGIESRGGITVILNCTITGNQAPSGAGVGTRGFPYTKTQVGNSIIAGNTGSTDVGILSMAGGADYISLGGNVIGYSTTTVTAFTPATGDQVGTSASPLNAKLGPLADNGGPTMTYALLPGSPAINSGLVAALPLDTLNLYGNGTDTPLPYDQRGVGFPRSIGRAPDVGAFESTVVREIKVFSRAGDTDTELASGQATAVDFGTINALDPRPLQIFVVKNIGTVPLHLNSIGVSAGFSLMAPFTARTLEPGDSFQFMVSYDALVLGTTTGSITLVSDDDQAASFTIPVSGTRVNAPPTVSQVFPDLTQIRPALPTEIDLAAHFADTETPSAQLIYTTEMTGSTTASTARNGNVLSISGNTPGDLAVTVTATDPQGLSVSSSFDIHIKAIPLIVGTGIPGTVISPAQPDRTIPLAGYFTDADGDALTWSVVAGHDTGILTASVTGSTFTLHPVSPGITTVTIRATDSDGNTVDNAFTVTVENPIPALVLTPGKPARFNPQTGLYEITYTATNTNQLEIPGFRLRVTSALPAGMILRNSTGPAGAYAPYLDVLARVAPGQFIVVALEFYSPTRNYTNFHPVIVAEPLPAETTDEGTGAGIAVTRIQKLPGGEVLIEFTSERGRFYQIEYSPDMVTWKKCLVPVEAGGNRVQWIDRGPPYTDSHPSTQSSRFYRVSGL